MTARLMLAEVDHVRTAPIRHRVANRMPAWLLDLRPDEPARPPWWLRPLASFNAADHLAGPHRDWYANLQQFAAEQGVGLTGRRVTVLTGSRTLGHAFDPLTVYWVRDPDETVVAVIAEVRNTYGGRHCYLVRPDASDRAEVEKQLYVSPFNAVDGHYRMHLPAPTNSFDVRITLHRPAGPPFVTRWRGSPASGTSQRLRLAALLIGGSRLTSLRIRRHGVWLWLRRVPIQPRTPARSEGAS